MGMRTNVKKAEVMKVCDDAPPMSITVNDEPVSGVSSMKYLSSKV